MLSMRKSDYQSNDFFSKSEFRGLFLADHQEIVGEKAFDYVDDINRSTLSKFGEIPSFRDATIRK